MFSPHLKKCDVDVEVQVLSSLWSLLALMSLSVFWNFLWTSGPADCWMWERGISPTSIDVHPVKSLSSWKSTLWFFILHKLVCDTAQRNVLRKCRESVCQHMQYMSFWAISSSSVKAVYFGTFLFTVDIQGSCCDSNLTCLWRRNPPFEGY